MCKAGGKILHEETEIFWLGAPTDIFVDKSL